MAILKCVGRQDCQDTFEMLAALRWSGEVAPLEDLEALADLSSLMDEDEVIHEFVADDPESFAWRVEHNNSIVLALEAHGWVHLFTEDGQLPLVERSTVPLPAVEAATNKLASVIAPLNSPVLGRMFAGYLQDRETLVYEDEAFRHTRLPNGMERLVMMDNGEPVGGITFKESVIDIAYTAQSHRRQGVASKLFQRARMIDVDLQHSDVLTEDGRKFADNAVGYDAPLYEADLA